MQDAAENVSNTYKKLTSALQALKRAIEFQGSPYECDDCSHWV